MPNKMSIKSFYYAKCPHNRIVIYPQTFSDGAHPMIWNNKGLFCVIPVQTVQNAIDLGKDKDNLPILNSNLGNIIHWDEGKIICAEIAKMLFSE